MQPGNFNAPSTNGGGGGGSGSGPRGMMNPNAALVNQAKEHEESAKRKAVEDAQRKAQEAIDNRPKTLGEVPQDQQYIIQQLQQLHGALQQMGLSGLQVRTFELFFYLSKFGRSASIRCYRNM